LCGRKAERAWVTRATEVVDPGPVASVIRGGGRSALPGRGLVVAVGLRAVAGGEPVRRRRGTLAGNGRRAQGCHRSCSSRWIRSTIVAGVPLYERERLPPCIIRAEASHRTHVNTRDPRNSCLISPRKQAMLLRGRLVLVLRGRLCRLVVFYHSCDAFTLWRDAIFFREVKR
jgi:hypothetical protein